MGRQSAGNVLCLLENLSVGAAIVSTYYWLSDALPQCAGVVTLWFLSGLFSMWRAGLKEVSSK